MTGVWYRKDNQTLSLVESGHRLVLTDGSYCKTSSDETIQKIRASTVIDFVCDMAIFGSGTPRLIAQFPPIDENAACAFYFEWKTHVRFNDPLFRSNLVDLVHSMRALQARVLHGDSSPHWPFCE